MKGRAHAAEIVKQALHVCNHPPNPADEWRIKAALSHAGMQVFRQLACEQVAEGDHGDRIVLSGSGNPFRSQAHAE